MNDICDKPILIKSETIQSASNIKDDISYKMFDKLCAIDPKEFLFDIKQPLIIKSTEMLLRENLEKRRKIKEKLDDNKVCNVMYYKKILLKKDNVPENKITEILSLLEKKIRYQLKLENSLQEKIDEQRIQFTLHSKK